MKALGSIPSTTPNTKKGRGRLHSFVLHTCMNSGPVIWQYLVQVEDGGQTHKLHFRILVWWACPRVPASVHDLLFLYSSQMLNFSKSVLLFILVSISVIQLYHQFGGQHISVLYLPAVNASIYGYSQYQGISQRCLSFLLCFSAQKYRRWAKKPNPSYCW